MKKEIVTGIVTASKVALTEFMKSETLQRTVLGAYSDGKPRSVVDAITGEVMSPKSKMDMEKRIQKSKKKKKKKKKNGKKYAKIDLWE